MLMKWMLELGNSCLHQQVFVDQDWLLPKREYYSPFYWLPPFLLAHMPGLNTKNTNWLRLLMCENVNSDPRPLIVNRDSN